MVYILSAGALIPSIQLCPKPVRKFPSVLVLQNSIPNYVIRDVQHSPACMSATDKVGWVFCSLNSCHFLMEEFRKAAVKLGSEAASHFSATLVSGKYFQTST